MALTIFKKEMHLNRKNFFIWGGVISFVTFFVMSFFPSMAKMGDKMEAMMEGLPENMVKAFNMAPDMYSNILGFYSTYYGMHIMILSCIFSVTLAGNILAREEREGTADFLLTRPVSRTQIVKEKLATVICYVIGLMSLQTLLAWIGIQIFAGNQDYSNKAFLTMTAYGFMLNLFFAGLGYFVSILRKRGASVTGLAVGIVIGGFILNALSRISPDSEWIGWFTPFKYADFNAVNYGYALEWWRVLVLLGGGLLMMAATFVIYRKKDIYN